MKIREIIKKIILGKRSSSKSYIEYLRDIGVEIGEDVTIYAPSKTLIDEQYPWMIAIGNHVRITEGVKILTHDYSWSVLKRLRGCVLGSSGKVVIGNNVFIGMNSIITCDVNVADNVIIGAGSVVTKDCEENGVYAGVPAKKIMNVDEYYKKRIKSQIKEAKRLALAYYERYGRRPEPSIFHEYFMLFETDSSVEKHSLFKNKMKLCENEIMSMEYMKKNGPKFRNYEEFMRYCFNDESK